MAKQGSQWREGHSQPCAVSRLPPGAGQPGSATQRGKTGHSGHLTAQAREVRGSGGGGGDVWAPQARGECLQEPGGAQDMASPIAGQEDLKGKTSITWGTFF